MKCVDIVSTPCTLFDIIGHHTTHKLREILPNSCLFPCQQRLDHCPTLPPVTRTIAKPIPGLLLARVPQHKPCRCSHMVVRPNSSYNSTVNRPCSPQRQLTTSPTARPTPTPPRHQAQLPVKNPSEIRDMTCPGWNMTLSAGGSPSTLLSILLPDSATAGLLHAAPDMSLKRASRTAWNAVTATELAARGNAGYSSPSTRVTL